MKVRTHIVASLAFAFASSAFADAVNFDQEITAIIRDYDSAAYDTPDKETKIKAFDAVAKRAERLVKQYPTRAEPQVWQGMALGEQSAADRNLGMVKQARKILEAATAIDPNPYAVDAYSTLGGIHANVPGFPIAFGDKKKAAAYFQKALAINPSNLGANLGYARLLFKLDDYAGALKYATVTTSATPRPGRDKADKAAYAKAQEIISQSKAKLR